MNMYFVRHGESVANVNQVFSNRVEQNHPLTNLGISQARELAHKLANISPLKIYTSPLIRATQTAEIISKQLGSVMEVAPALREYDVGILEEQPYSAERLAVYANNEQEWLVNNNLQHKIQGGESFIDIKDRFVTFVNKLTEEYAGSSSNILIISHGGIYRCLLPLVFSNISVEFARQHMIDHCDVVMGEWENDEFICMQWGSVGI